MIEYLYDILNELFCIVLLIVDSEVDKFVEQILLVDQIFIFGVGCFGFMVKVFVMRMMYIGLNVYIVGEMFIFFF